MLPIKIMQWLRLNLLPANKQLRDRCRAVSSSQAARVGACRQRRARSHGLLLEVGGARVGRARVHVRAVRVDRAQRALASEACVCRNDSLLQTRKDLLGPACLKVCA